MNITVIGGGLAGVFAAKTLIEKGETVTIIEKSRSIGGRMATRRIGEGRADHGAQFFTVRSIELEKLTEEWLENKWIKRWFGDDYPRYSGMEGMNSFIKKIAQNLPVTLQERVDHIEAKDTELILSTNTGKKYTSDAVVLTAPVPQALELLEKSPIHVTNQDKNSLAASKFKPCFVGLLTLKKPVSIGENGIISDHVPAGVDKIVANDQKGISHSPILSVYMNGDWSRDHFALKDDEVLNEIVAILSPDLIESNNLSAYQLKRWRYAEATHVYREPFLKLKNYPIFIAGDSFLTKNDTSGRTRIESAILSGIRVGEATYRDSRY
ncbi:NAD(P)/FAD-dependent oxidoreductase [Salipaludibacillus sp. CF4.18]|uniref:NAD(P)/FAD-dependent oxidoreductase n=1 Tax=Salipaludibacillus sp. CF4.18 TaxID=3373081 RepID=UPI003EE61E20